MSSVARLLAQWLWQQAGRPGSGLALFATEAIDDLGDRGQLLAIEARADISRVVRLFFIALFGCLAAFTALSWVSAAIILLTWDTPSRALVVVSVAGGWVCIAAACIGIVRSRWANAPRPLERSRTLFDEDLASLRRFINEGRS